MHLPAYLILCLFAVVLSVIRLFVTGDTYFNGLVWNLILAFLPYVFALFFVRFGGWKRWLAFLLWFFFLPNSFYILTDFVHLSYDASMIYYDIVLITTMTFAAMVSGYASMELIHREWNIHYHKLKGWILIITVSIVSMIGVYMGRFLRFNSWDLWHDPLSLIREAWLLIVTNGSVWQIGDATRSLESAKYATGAMGLWQFVLPYGSFFLIVYAFIYHSKKGR